MHSGSVVRHSATAGSGTERGRSVAVVTRAVHRFREYKFGPDLQPAAEPITTAMQCKACGLTGGTAEEPADGSAWAVGHLKANLDHLEYREHIRRPYRFEAGAWQ